MKIPQILLCLFLMILAGRVSTSWAGEKKSSVSSTQSKNNLGNSDVDKEVDNGEDDDKSTEETEPSKFKKDSDDSYVDSSSDEDGWLKSRFKEDKDGDDKDTDASDEE